MKFHRLIPIYSFPNALLLPSTCLRCAVDPPTDCHCFFLQVLGNWAIKGRLIDERGKFGIEE